MKKLLTKLPTLVAVFVMAAVFSISKTYAQECYTTYSGGYGGGEVCDEGNVSLDKVVWQYQDNDGNEVKAWKDNIDSSDYKFVAGEEMRFELRVKNTGDVELNAVTVRDILPSYLNWKSGGEYFSSTRTVEWKLYNLEPGGTEVVQFTAVFVSSSDLPAGITCVTNKGEVYVDDSDARDVDTAVICAQKGESEKKTVLGVTTLPETGPEMPVVTIVISSLVGLGGVALLKAKKGF